MLRYRHKIANDITLCSVIIRNMEANGDSPLDKINDTLRLLAESSARNWDEHERIWQAVGTLHTEVKNLTAQVENLVGAIRALVDHIPPESLR